MDSISACGMLRAWRLLRRRLGSDLQFNSELIKKLTKKKFSFVYCETDSFIFFKTDSLIFTTDTCEQGICRMQKWSRNILINLKQKDQSEEVNCPHWNLPIFRVRIGTSSSEWQLTLPKLQSKVATARTVSTRDTETTIFDPASEFLNFLYLVYLLYCYFTSNLRKSRLQFLSVSFYVPSTHCRG